MARTIRAAWTEALYGPAGRFATSNRRDFSTALTDPVTGPVLADAFAALAAETDRRLGEPAGFAVVDVGAGTGAFLDRLARSAPDRWRLVGVEVGPRPPGLHPRIAWETGLSGPYDGFLLAHEWLDDVPLDVVRDGRAVLEDGSSGDPHDTTWVQEWGGEEDGSARDAAWRAATGHLRRGTALAVDYGHTRATRRTTLTGWRDGRPVPPTFDGSCDVTAHVALDSLVAAVPGQVLTSQRDALAHLEPLSLPEVSAVRVLRDPAGYGAYGWVRLDRP